MTITQTIPFGERLSDSRIVTASEVPRGDACGCVCPECGGSLQAHHGDVLRWHFQHKAEVAGCRGGAESALHKFAKQIIAEKRSICLPPLVARYKSYKGVRHELKIAEAKRVKLSNIRLEERVRFDNGEFIVPDIVAEMSTREHGNRIARGDVIIEIVVTHAADAKKTSLLAAKQISAFEIYLAGLSTRFTPTLYECVADIIRDAPRSWLWHGKQDEIDAIYADAIARDQIVRLKHFERQRRQHWKAAERRRFYNEMLEARNEIIHEAVNEANKMILIQTRDVRFQLEWTEKWHGKYAADRLEDWINRWRERPMPTQAAE